MGDDDDYGEEEYGEEEGGPGAKKAKKAKGKVQEEEYDFM